MNTERDPREEEWDECWSCDGTGVSEDDQEEDCPECGGAGGEWKLPSDKL